MTDHLQDMQWKAFAAGKQARLQFSLRACAQGNRRRLRDRTTVPGYQRQLSGLCKQVRCDQLICFANRLFIMRQLHISSLHRRVGEW